MAFFLVWHVGRFSTGQTNHQHFSSRHSAERPWHLAISVWPSCGCTDGEGETPALHFSATLKRYI